MTSTDDIISQITKFNPANWQDLSDSAKFLKGCYAHFVRSAGSNICDVIVSPQASNLDLIGTKEAASSFTFYEDLSCDASALYFGAQVCIKEMRDGSFDEDDALTHRISDALASGKLVFNFVECARMIAATNLLFSENEKTHTRILEGQDAASILIYDYSHKIVEEYGKMQGILLPKIDTVLSIVQDELGILPTSIGQIITQVMQSIPG